MNFLSTMMRYFDEVAREGSVRRASARLNVSASAVNRQILMLEEKVGQPLFDRFPRGMRITEAGQIVLDALRRSCQDGEFVESQLDALKGLKRGHAAFGALFFLSESYIPGLIARLRTLYPEVSYSAYFGNSSDITARVLDGRLDIGLCWDPPPSINVQRHAVRKVPLGVAAVPAHPIASSREIRLRELLGYPVIYPTPGTDYRAILDRIDVGPGRAMVPAIQTTSMSMMRRLALAGVGVALVNRAAVINELRAGTLILRPLSDPGSQTLSLSLFSRANRSLPVAVSMMLQQLALDFDDLAGEPAPAELGRD